MKPPTKTIELIGIRLYALFALRLAISWHFLCEGVNN